jgi:hypothetical protein
MDWIIQRESRGKTKYRNAIGLTESVKAARHYETASAALADAHDGDTIIQAPALCAWYLKCENPATRLVPHPVLGNVPACERCAKLAGHAEPPQYHNADGTVDEMPEAADLAAVHIEEAAKCSKS